MKYGIDYTERFKQKFQLSMAEQQCFPSYQAHLRAVDAQVPAHASTAKLSDVAAGKVRPPGLHVVAANRRK